MKKSLEKCPVCAGKMVIKEIACSKCETRVISEFKLEQNPLGISDEILDFIKVFIYSEGSIKQSEKIMNCSYPKIKNLLKKTKLALGINDFESVSNNAVLDQLDRGDIDVEAALNLIKSRKK